MLTADPAVTLPGCSVLEFGRERLTGQRPART